jgi:hypothetical protein
MAFKHFMVARNDQPKERKMTDRYFRKGLKWAKVSGQRGKWTVALGWKSETQASSVRTTPTKLLAEVIARNFVDDQ